jgi:hypothetical protein
MPLNQVKMQKNKERALNRFLKRVFMIKFCVLLALLLCSCSSSPSLVTNHYIIGFGSTSFNATTFSNTYRSTVIGLDVLNGRYSSVGFGFHRNHISEVDYTKMMDAYIQQKEKELLANFYFLRKL